MRMLSVLPRVTERTRERVAREFDDLGPDVCMNSIMRDLQRHNPELLDMASKWANDVGAAERIITAFGMFYRLLSAETLSPLEPQAVSPLPRVSAATRGLIVQRIDQVGGESFTHDAIERIEATNPELLQSMALPQPARIMLASCRASSCFMKRFGYRRRVTRSSSTRRPWESFPIANLTAVKARPSLSG